MEYIDEFLMFEKENDLNKKIYNGYLYWTYNRFNIFEEINSKINSLSGEASSKAAIRTILKGVMRTLRHKKKLKKADIIFLNGNQRVLQDGIFVSVYMEDLISYYKENAIVFEGMFEGHHFEPNSTPNLYYTDRIDMFSEVFVRFNYLFGKHFKAYKELRNNARAISVLVESKWGFDIEETLTKMFVKGYFQFCYWNKIFDRILRQVNPKIIIEIDSYCAIRNMVINELAKKRNIITVELQHGTMGSSHIGYNYLNTYIAPFPQKIFLWSQYWKDTTRIPLNKENVVITGFPYFENSVKKYNTVPWKERNIILFISQITIGKELSDFAIRLNELLKKQNKYKIYYKLHPQECENWEILYPKLRESGIVVLSDRKSIYEYFARSAIQIGVYSTAILEGVAFGLQSYCLDLPIAEYHFKDFFEMGMIRRISDPIEIMEDINSLDINRNNKKEEITYLWMSNSLDKMIAEIDRMLLS